MITALVIATGSFFAAAVTAFILSLFEDPGLDDDGSLLVGIASAFFLMTALCGLCALLVQL